MMKRSTALLLAATLLAGCGGGGSGGSDGEATPPATTAQGLWTGTTSTNRAITGLVLSDGATYVLYSAIGNPNFIAGVVQGTGTSSAGSYSSANTRDFNLEGFGVLPATVSATYVSKQSFGGTITYSATTSTTFAATYDASYEAIPSLANLAGTFTGQVASSAGTEAAAVTISATGVITGGSSGCATSGTVTPRSDANAYDVSLRFGPFPCHFANQTLAGIAYFSSTTRTIYAVTPNAARTDGVLFVGTKP